MGEITSSGIPEQGDLKVPRINKGLAMIAGKHLFYNKEYAIMKPQQANLSSILGDWHMFTRGCRVSTGEQIVELQAEVSVRTLVKQPTKN